MQDLNIAFIQANLKWEDAAANRQYFDHWISGLHRHPDLLILPETFTTGFPVDPQRFAEQADGPTLQWMRQKAVSMNTVVCGSLLLQQEDSFFNCLVWMQPDGNYLTYAKRHVFRMGGEHKLIHAGSEMLIAELKGWKVKPLICYDLRFPVWSKNTLTANGYAYDLLIYVANWPEVRSYPWKQLLIARAIENQAYVLGLNRVGVDGPGNSYSGDSMLIDPRGNPLFAAEAYAELAESYALNYDDLLNFRQKFNVSLDWDDFNMNFLPPKN